MEVVYDLAAFRRPPGGSAVTIGAYDGVHLGHQQLLARLRSEAAARRCASAVVTFDRHPAVVVRPASAPKQLTDLETKLELLAATGIDLTLVVHFDLDRSREPAEDFVRTILVDGLDARVVAVGSDFHFGHNRGGNVAFLERLAPSCGFEVLPIELIADGAGTDKVSSTGVRAALAAGDVTAAAALLGRPHRVRGRVGGGDRGDEPAVPMVSVAVPGDICLPADGVYAGWCDCPDGVRWAAALSVSPRLVQARLIDAAGAPTDGEAVVEFASRLERDEPVDGARRLDEAVRTALR